MTPPGLPTPWRKSSYSGSNEGNCVEIADLNNHIGIRDSKNLTAGHLTLTREAFTTLLTHLTSRP
ncbi:DUF397 domain-containing protein [Actinomadura luteofluorescens]|uniref:DUF397 domain-containing protein n=1 Tax=Actinomadura luteofluorescens TaxID=46163 RepID=UPI0030D3A1C7